MGLFGSIGNFLKGAAKKIGGVGKKIFSGVESVGKKIGNIPVIGSIAKGAADTLGVSDLFNTAKDAFNTGVDAVDRVGRSKNFDEVIGNFTKGKSEIDKAGGKLAEDFLNTRDKVKDLKKDPGKIIENLR